MARVCSVEFTKIFNSYGHKDPCSWVKVWHQRAWMYRNVAFAGVHITFKGQKFTVWHDRIGNAASVFHSPNSVSYFGVAARVLLGSYSTITPGNNKDFLIAPTHDSCIYPLFKEQSWKPSDAYALIMWNLPDGHVSLCTSHTHLPDMTRIEPNFLQRGDRIFKQHMIFLTGTCQLHDTKCI